MMTIGAQRREQDARQQADRPLPPAARRCSRRARRCDPEPAAPEDHRDRRDPERDRVDRRAGFKIAQPIGFEESCGCHSLTTRYWWRKRQVVDEVRGSAPALSKAPATAICSFLAFMRAASAASASRSATRAQFGASQRARSAPFGSSNSASMPSSTAGPASRMNSHCQPAHPHHPIWFAAAPPISASPGSPTAGSRDHEHGDDAATIFRRKPVR